MNRDAIEPGNRAAGSESRARILVVDDDRTILRSLVELLRLDGHEVQGAGSLGAARAALRQNTFDVVLADVQLGDGDGLSILRHVRETGRDALPVMITAYGTIASAVQAMRLGAFDYLTKPIDDEVIRAVIRRAMEHLAVVRENRALREQLRARFSLENVIGRTHQMQRVFDLIEAVADSRTTILMRGETGTGKSLVARAVHQRSARRGKPFVEISCGAIPETLLESELFGHVRGAFTGATSDKEGRFEAAGGGTIFLDEISSASPSLQVKLLRVLQERQFERLGSNRTLTTDVRVILATNVDLAAEVAAGRFRQDLYYRVNVVTIEIPPLRERLGDIPLLTEHFLAKYAAQTGRHVVGFSPEALQCMQRYRWPGNVRELENCVERAVVLSRGEQISAQDLPEAVIAGGSGSEPELVAPTGQTTLRAALEGPERRIIEAALRAHAWNRQATAAALDVDRTTLYKKMKRYGLLQHKRNAGK